MQQAVFIIIVGVVAFFGYQRFTKIRRNILLGKPESIGGNTGERWKNVFLIALGQKKMFKNWIPAVFHFFIYAAFLLTQVELLEILIDGFSGDHRFFATKLGGFYNFLLNFIEILSVLAFVATVVFLARRNVLKVKRFQMPELKGWPFRDGNLILMGEVLLLTGIFSMNGADALLQCHLPAHYHDTGTLAISSVLGPFLFGDLSIPTLEIIERFGWWLHILVVFGFILYLPFSKHLHIFLAFVNTWYAKLTPKGQMENMPEIMQEVKSMLGLAEPTPATEELPVFGANDVTSLSWKNILDAYTCTECGRCTSACPANITGKKLSPRKIMMDVRDRADEIGKKIDSGEAQYIREELREPELTLTKDTFDDGKSLFDYITPEEIHACTTCNACVEACPVLINPLDIILKLRRHEILVQSAGPTDWLPMFNSLENGGAVWQMPEERAAWVDSYEL